MSTSYGHAGTTQGPLSRSLKPSYVDDMAQRLSSRLHRWFGNPAKEFIGSASEVSTFADKQAGLLAEIFFSGRCRRLHKWPHYLPIYERYFADWRDKSPRFLEIGVFGGGSLDMWREYFGPSTTIYGIDINSECARLARPPTQIRIGSQDDAEFLRRVVDEMGGIDIVLDDGSHVGKHQRKSFEILFPLLSEGGIYMIEDTHTSYWRRFGGGYRRRGTAIEWSKQIVDDMHAWYHGGRTRTSARDDVAGVHVHDSIIVIEKGARARPMHVIIEPRKVVLKPAESERP